MEPPCKKCSKQVRNRGQLQCSQCSGKYHLDCTSVTYRRYLLMTEDCKKTWICDFCRNLKASSNQNQSGTPSGSMCQGKTYKINIPVDNSFEALSDNLSEIEDMSFTSLTPENTLNRSCPDLKIDTKEYSKELENRIASLERNLLIAEKEIENLNLENMKLLKKNSEYQKKIEKLTHICTSEVKTKKRRNINRSSLYCAQNESFEEIMTQKTVLEAETPSGKRRQTNIDNATPKKEPTLDGAVLNYTTKNNKPNDDNILHETTKDYYQNEKENTTRRVQIFADEQGRGVCKHLQITLGCGYKVFSDFKPGAATDKVLEYMKITCSDYGKNDFILILTGTNDKDPTKQTSYLYYYLSQLQHTNIILCGLRHNKYLNVDQINKTFRLLSTQLSHVNYIDLHYYSYSSQSKFNTKNLCQNVLQEILRFEYYHKLINRQEHLTKKIYTKIKESLRNSISNRPPQKHDLENEETFFRR